MKLNDFRFEFKKVNGFELTKDWIMFRKPFELWNSRTNKSIKAKKLDDVLDTFIEGKTIKEHIEAMEHITLPPLTGGRGSSGNKSFKFSFRDRGKDKGRNSTPDFPARANVRIKSKTLESAMQEFRQHHKDLNKEWAYEVDSQGFVHQYIEGAKGSVSIGSRQKGTMILHNHPSFGEPNFSGADLLSTSYDSYAKGIVASSKNMDYVFKKGSHFKANNFIKALKRADLQGRNYSDAVDKWLSKNQKKYGYTYYKTNNHLKK